MASGITLRFFITLTLLIHAGFHLLSIAPHITPLFTSAITSAVTLTINHVINIRID